MSQNLPKCPQIYQNAPLKKKKNPIFPEIFWNLCSFLRNSQKFYVFFFSLDHKIYPNLCFSPKNLWNFMFFFYQITKVIQICVLFPKISWNAMFFYHQITNFTEICVLFPQISCFSPSKSQKLPTFLFLSLNFFFHPNHTS